MTKKKSESFPFTFLCSVQISTTTSRLFFEVSSLMLHSLLSLFLLFFPYIRARSFSNDIGFVSVSSSLLGVLWLGWLATMMIARQQNTISIFKTMQQRAMHFEWLPTWDVRFTIIKSRNCFWTFKIAIRNCWVCSLRDSPSTRQQAVYMYCVNIVKFHLSWLIF